MHYLRYLGTSRLALQVPVTRQVIVVLNFVPEMLKSLHCTYYTLPAYVTSP